MNKLYVANIDPETTTEAIAAAFGKDVTHVELGVEHRPGGRKNEEPIDVYFAIVTMTSEKIATKTMHAMNGYVIDGRRIVVSPAELSKIKPLMPKQRKVMEDIAEKLQETDEKPLRMLEAIVMLCGVGFAETNLQEVLEVEEAGGLMTRKQDRKRTIGGVFFYICRFRMAPAMRRIVYNRKGRLPMEEETPEVEAESA